MGRMRNALSERGQALLEFALVIPVLLLVAVGAVEFGIAYNNYLRLTDAVRVSGRAAAATLPPAGLLTLARNDSDPSAPPSVVRSCRAGLARLEGLSGGRGASCPA
jgi:hypothetical protein